MADANTLTYEKKSTSEYRKEITADIITSMKDGKAPWQVPEMVAQVGIPKNPRTENKYRGAAAVVLMNAAIKKGFKSPNWISLNEAKKEGYIIKEGEKSTKIEVAMFNKNKELDRIFYTPMFNADQLSNCPSKWKESLPVTIQPNIELAQKAIEKSNVQVSHNLEPGKTPNYDARTDTITIQPQESFNSKEEYYAEMMCQLTHATGHYTRGNRDSVNATDIGSPKRAEEEMKAEIASLFTRLEMGFKVNEKHFADHAWANEINISAMENSTKNGHFFVVANQGGKMAYHVKCLAEEPQEQTKEQETVNIKDTIEQATIAAHGAKVTEASSTKKYKGEVVGITDSHVVLQINKNDAVIVPKDTLKVIPQIKETISISNEVDGKRTIEDIKDKSLGH